MENQAMDVYLSSISKCLIQRPGNCAAATQLVSRRLDQGSLGAAVQLEIADVIDCLAVRR